MADTGMPRSRIILRPTAGIGNAHTLPDSNTLDTGAGPCRSGSGVSCLTGVSCRSGTGKQAIGDP